MTPQDEKNASFLTSARANAGCAYFLGNTHFGGPKHDFWPVAKPYYSWHFSIGTSNYVGIHGGNTILTIFGVPEAPKWQDHGGRRACAAHNFTALSRTALDVNVLR